jgi:hypothetical protein
VTTYRKLAGEYNEVEGTSPDGKWTLVESSREQGGRSTRNSRYIDIWKLKLEANSDDFVRLTRWGDFEGYKASNPVVSNDGKTDRVPVRPQRRARRGRARHLPSHAAMKTARTMVGRAERITGPYIK